jgi:amidase
MKAWQEVAAEQQRVRDAAIPTEWILKNPPADTAVNVMDVPYTCGILTKRELELTDKDATELLELLAEGEVTSFEVTLAFCKRCAIAQQLVCSLPVCRWV